MNNRTKVAAIFAGLAVVMASVGAAYWFRQTPTGAWDRLRHAACAGDAVTFAAGVDRAAIARGLTEGAPFGANSPMAKLAEAALVSRLVALEDDVKHGSASGVCGWAYVDTAGEYVRFVSVQGEALVARFQKFDGNWLLVGFEPESANP